MAQPVHLLLILSAMSLGLAACESEQADAVAATTAAEPPPALIDQALLADVLGEAVQADGNGTVADGLLVRLAFDPLIRQTGPVSLQLVQSTGYRLLGVAQGAPLWQLGLREGDILVTVDDEPIIGRENEMRSRWERRPSSTEIGYQRDGQARTLSLRIQPGTAWRGSEPTQPAPDLVDPFRRTNLDLDPRPEVAPGMRCVPVDTADSLGRCEIERATIERLFEDPSSVMTQMRVIPAMQDGVSRGFKIAGIRGSSVPSQLGLKNGDVLVAFDGQPLGSIDAAITAFARLREVDTVALTIERRGVPKRLTISIVDALN
jgi:S1-C subfamily serine protease